jgi:hypothetical protein
MGELTSSGYEPDDSDELFTSLGEALLNENADANPFAESTYTWALLTAIANTRAEREQLLSELYDAAYVATASDEQLTEKCRNLGVYRREPQRATGVVRFSRSDPATTDYVIPTGTIVETLETDAVQFATTESAVIAETETSVDVTVEAVDGGADGNVGANAIGAMPSSPSGVESVTNPDPTGDPSLTDTNGQPLRVGRDRESDEDLRARTLDTDAVSEGPSVNGVEKALNNIDDLVSVTVESNQTNSTVDGLAPYETEVIAYGGDVQSIAETLRDTMSVTTLLRLVGGVNGSQVTTDVYVSLLDQLVTVPLTRPTETTVTVEVDLVVDGTYVGDDSVTDAIVTYVGGSNTNGATETGLGIGVDIRVNEIENRIEGVQGVLYGDVTLADTNNDGTDDTTTDSDGIPIVPISDTNVPRVDAADVTVTTTVK